MHSWPVIENTSRPDSPNLSLSEPQSLGFVRTRRMGITHPNVAISGRIASYTSLHGRIVLRCGVCPQNTSSAAALLQPKRTRYSCGVVTVRSRPAKSDDRWFRFSCAVREEVYTAVGSGVASPSDGSRNVTSCWKRRRSAANTPASSSSTARSTSGISRVRIYVRLRLRTLRRGGAQAARLIARRCGTTGLLSFLNTCRSARAIVAAPAVSAHRFYGASRR